MATYFCPNLSNPDVKKDFESLVKQLGENKAYFQWNKHQGDMTAISNDVNFAGKKSIKEKLPKNKIFYQNNTDQTLEEYVASEKTIRDLAERMADRIGLTVKYESDRTKDYKGKLEGNTAVINLAYATLDTPIHEILGHPIIRAIKKRGSEQTSDPFMQMINDDLTNDSQLYKNLLKELEYGKGKEVLDRIKRDYAPKPIDSGTYSPDDNVTFPDFDSQEDYDIYLKNHKEYQKEEAIVELLGLYTADRLDKVKDGKLISLLKRLLKEMKAYMKSLFNAKEVKIDELPDNMTLGDVADLLAYSNSKLILPGNEVVYTTPDNKTFKTYQEASNHISELIKLGEVDLSMIESPKESKNVFEIINTATGEVVDEATTKEDALYIKSDIEYDDPVYTYIVRQRVDTPIERFIEKNKEYEQSKEIIEKWKKVNDIKYDPEEVYSRGQGFYSVVGAYSDFDVELMFQNLLAHIQDNKKAGGEFTISAFTKPVDKKINHLEGGGGKIKFKIFPKSEDIKWAANTDVHSGSVWDASEKVSKDSKSEIIGVSYTKSPSLKNIGSVQPNLASIIDNLAHHHNELGIELTGNNFRLEYDENVPYSTKKLINNINNILDQKFGKLTVPEIATKDTGKVVYRVGAYFLNEFIAEFDSKEKAQSFIDNYNVVSSNMPIKEDLAITPSGVLKGKVPTQTTKNTMSIRDVAIDYSVENSMLPPNTKEYTSQAEINTKIAALKKGQRKFERSLIRSEVRKVYTNEHDKAAQNLGFTPGELPFQKISKPIPPKRSMPSGHVSGARDLLSNNKYANNDIKQVDQEFNLVSIKNIKGEVFKFYNPLNKSEIDSILNYLDKYYLNWSYDLVDPWNDNPNMYGLRISGNPINVDKQISEAQVRLERAIMDKEINVDIAPLHTKAQTVESVVPEESKQHYNKVKAILDRIDANDNPYDFLEYLRDENLIADQRLLTILDIILNNQSDNIKIGSKRISELAEDEEGAYMFFQPKDNTIQLVKEQVLDSFNGDFDYFIRSILHEYIHAFTNRVIEQPETKEEEQLAKEFKKLYNQAKAFVTDETKKTFKNAFLDEHEFVAVLMTDPDFLRAMRREEKYNWWHKFLAWLGKTFKIEQLSTKYETIDSTIFEMVIDTIPFRPDFMYNTTGATVSKMPLKDKIYEFRETIDPSNREEFVQHLSDFKKNFKFEKGGIRYKDTGFIINGVTTIMKPFGFDVNQEELDKNEKLQEALDRANAVGTVTHGVAESILTGKTARISNDLGFTSTPGLRKDLSAILERFKGQNVTVLSEVFVSDLRKGIGGFIDMMIVDENNDIHIYDFKSKEKGFSKYSTRYLNQKSGELNYSDEQRAHAQLTLYKEIFQSMSGLPVKSINVVLLQPSVDGNQVVGATLHDVRKFNRPSDLGEAIYGTVENINSKIDPDMAKSINEQRLKTLDYKRADFSKLDNAVEEIVSDLQNRLKLIKKRGNILEAKELEDDLDKALNALTSSESLKHLLQSGLTRTANIQRDYAKAKKEGKDIKIGQLFHWKEVVEGYNGFQEYALYLKEQIPLLEGKRLDVAKKIDEDIKELRSRIEHIANLYTNEGMEKLLDFLVPYYNRVRVEEEQQFKKAYRTLPQEKKDKMTEQEFIKESFEKLGLDSDISVRTRELLREELKKASRDIGTMGLWLANLMDSRDPVISAMVKAFAEKEYMSHTQSVDVRDALVNKLKNFEKTVDTNILTDPKKIYDFMLEKDENGEYTGYLIDRFNSSLFEDYNEIITETRSLSLDKLKELSEKDSMISKIATFHYDKHKNDNIEDIPFLDIQQDIRKVWKNTVTRFDKERFKKAKDSYLNDMIGLGELTHLEYEEILNNDAKFARGESELTLMALANAGEINKPAAEKISNWIYNNAWNYREIREAYKSKYKNKDFANIESLPTEQKELYDFIRNLIEISNNKLPYSSRIGLRLPGVIKNTKEMLRSGDNIVGIFKEKLKSDFDVRPDDEERDNKELFNDNGKPRYFLPIHYTRKLDLELQSFDVPTIVFKFWQSANDFNNKAEILPEMELAKFFIENRTPNVKGNHWMKNITNKVFDKEDLKSYNNNLSKQLNEWFMTCVYGMPKRDQGKVLGIDVAKAVDALNQYTSLNLLGLNLIQGTANTILGEVLQTAERIAGEYMSKNAYRKGTQFYMSNFPGILGDIGARSSKNVVNKLMDEFDILDEWEGTKFSSDKRYRHAMASDALFFTTHAGEHEMQGRFLLSMLYDKKAYDKDGNELGSMLHQYEVKDGKLIINDNVDLHKSEWTEKDQFEFSYKVRGILSRLHGEYSDLGRVAIQRGALGRMAFMFRKFIEPGFKRRWGKLDYVERLGDYVEGSYLSTGKFFSRLLKDVWHFKFEVGQHWDTMSDHEKANVKRTLTELSFLITTIIFLNFAVAKLKDIDDEGEERMWAFLAYQSARLKSELLFFISPPEAWNILRSPMASMSVIENMIRLLGQLTTEPFELYERGPWKGQPKVAKYLTNMTPGYRQFYRIRDVRDQLAWFSNKVN